MTSVLDYILFEVQLSWVSCLGPLVLGQLSWVTRLAQSVLDHLSWITCLCSLVSRCCRNAVRHCSGALFGSLCGTGSAFANNGVLFQILFCAFVVFGSVLVRACWSRCCVACSVRCEIEDSVLFDVLFGAACTSLAPVPALPRSLPVLLVSCGFIGQCSLCRLRFIALCSVCPLRFTALCSVFSLRFAAPCCVDVAASALGVLWVYWSVLLLCFEIYCSVLCVSSEICCSVLC